MDTRIFNQINVCNKKMYRGISTHALAKTNLIFELKRWSFSNFQPEIWERRFARLIIKIMLEDLNRT